jgi:hypothetical protein
MSVGLLPALVAARVGSDWSKAARGDNKFRQPEFKRRIDIPLVRPWKNPLELLCADGKLLLQL